MTVKITLPPIYEQPEAVDDYRDEADILEEGKKAKRATVMAAREAAKRRKRLRTSSGSSATGYGKSPKLLLDYKISHSGCSSHFNKDSQAPDASALRQIQGSRAAQARRERLRMMSAGSSNFSQRIVMSA